MTRTTALPLRGLNVLDMSRVLAGPWCTMLLADHGATVLKVERPGVGDETRSWGPPFVSSSDGPHFGGTMSQTKKQLSTYFLSVNRGKKSVAIDLKKKAGLDICRRLAVEWADVIVENFKPGTMKEFGLDYENLQKQNSGLVYCSITGFGPSGPLADQPGYDVIVSGMYGLMSITGSEEEPAKVGVASTDVLTGTLAHSGIVAALYQRHQTGEGQKIDVSLMETQLASLVNIASSTLNARDQNRPAPKRWGTAHESIVPYQAFECKKISEHYNERQYVLVGAGNDSQFVQLCDTLGRPDLSTDSRFETNADRVQNRDDLLSDLKEMFLSKSRDEWVELLQGKGFPIGPLRTVNEAFDCEQARHRGMVETMEHPAVGEIRLPKTPITFTSIPTAAVTTSLTSPSSVVSPPPMLGEHTKEVLIDILGFESSYIRQLEGDKAIQCYSDY
jgi:succinate---hydroxymethylglutarate CoA-transferase